MSGSAKQSGSVEDAAQAGTACTSHLLRDISGLNCQVQMISDSLAACKRMSNYRSVRRDCNYAVMTQARSKPTPQTPVQVLLPPEERTLVFLPGRKWKSVIVSYMMNGKTNLGYLKKSSRFARREEVLSESNSGDDIRGACRSSRSRILEEVPQFSDVGICVRETVNSRWAFDAAIRGELETLMEMNPDLVLIITGLFDILCHCKGCSRCNRKVRSSISWILSRIQKLVNYVAIKKRKTCVLAHDPARLPNTERKEVLSEEPTEDRRRIGRSEKVEAFAVSANYPSIQILLQVKIETLGKRIFARTESRRVGPLIGAHPTLQLQESSTVPLTLGFQPRFIPYLERQFFALKKVRLDFRALLCREPSRVASSAVVRSLAVTTRTASSNSREPYEEARIQGQGRLLAVAERSESAERKRPAIQSREDLEKGEMHVQKVRELEGEVKGLKDLMLEVHKNQVELSRVLVEKGLRSRGLLLLGDPATLEEENEVSKNEKVLEIRKTSADGTQQKCSVKNRMIVTLLKGLRSDVPEEWWEELIKHVFDDETDPEKVDEFIRQTSLFLLDGEKGSTVPLPTPRNEGFSSEDEEGGSDPSSDESRVEDPVKGAATTAPPSSSFMQNILCDDFGSGAAIVDLIVAVKTAKDDLYQLSKTKSQALFRVNELKEEIGAVSEKTKTLLEQTEDVLRRLDEKAHGWTCRDPRFESEVCENELKAVFERPEKGKNEAKHEKEESEGSSDNMYDSELKWESAGKPAAAVADPQGKSQGPQRQTSVAVSGNKREGGVSVTDFAVQMICGICGILAGPQELKVEKSSEPSKPASPEKSGPSSDSVDANTGKKLFCWKCGSKLLKEAKGVGLAGANDSGRREKAAGGKDSEDETASDTESVFEEALSDPCPVPVDPRTKPSVTCMGDLTKTVKEKKSVSTLTATDDAASSWVGQLTEDIKNKIKSLKSMKKATAGEKSEKSVTSLLSAMELTIVANTPVGIFDVTVKQYQDRRRNSGMLAGPKNVVTAAAASQPVVPGIVSGFEPERHFCSDESLLYSDCEADNASDPGGDDLEEFLKLPNKSQEKDPSPPEKKGTMMAMLKADNALFFEVLKCNPRNFIQEMLPKAAEASASDGGRKDEHENVSHELSGSSGYEDLSRLPNKLVIEDSSSNLIIYVQMEMEEAEVNFERAEVYEGVKETTGIAEERKILGVEEAVTRPEEMENSKGESEKANQKTSTFFDKLLDVVTEKEIRDAFLEKPKKWRTAVACIVLESTARAEVCLQQILSLEVYKIERRKEKPRQLEQEPRPRAPELDRALSLIHEIENYVVKVKLSDAILILPHLERELQAYLRKKITEYGENDDFCCAKETGSEPRSGVSDDSEERLRNLLSLVSGLEKAVRLSEYDLCDRNSSKILRLLRALTHSARELEEDMTFGSLAEAGEAESLQEASAEEFPGKERLRSVRRKVFEVVQKEAVARERRILRDFYRIDRLEKENDEVFMFVELFLDKTQRRVTELEAVKRKLEELSSEVFGRTGRNEKEGAKDRSFLTTPSRDISPSARETPITDSLSGFLFALENLKLRAKKKSEICRKILGCFPKENKELPAGKKAEGQPSRISKSSFVSKTPDLASSIKDFRQIGKDSLYLSWTKPEGPLATSVTGFEILVNGKRHQKVRNPNRLQAVLYSVNLVDGTEVQLQAFIENSSKALLATVTYQSKK